MSQRSPILAAILSSLLPGLGQFYQGDRAKGIALLCISVGIAWGIGMALFGPSMFRSLLSVIMLGVVYVVVWVSAIVDAYQQTAGVARPLLSGDRAWYVIVLLITVGPMALPLLWQSPRFSKTAKIIWSLFVIIIALISIFLLTVMGPALERMLKRGLP